MPHTPPAIYNNTLHKGGDAGAAAPFPMPFGYFNNGPAAPWPLPLPPLPPMLSAPQQMAAMMQLMSLQQPQAFDPAAMQMAAAAAAFMSFQQQQQMTAMLLAQQASGSFPFPSAPLAGSNANDGGACGGAASADRCQMVEACGEKRNIPENEQHVTVSDHHLAPTNAAPVASQRAPVVDLTAATCYLCSEHGHWYSSCPLFDGHKVCLWNERDQRIYVMRHDDWIGSATLKDVHTFLRVSTGLAPSQYVLLIHQQVLPANKKLRCCDVGLVPGALVEVMLLEEHRYLMFPPTVGVTESHNSAGEQQRRKDANEDHRFAPSYINDVSPCANKHHHTDEGQQQHNTDEPDCAAACANGMQSVHDVSHISVASTSLLRSLPSSGSAGEANTSAKSVNTSELKADKDMRSRDDAVSAPTPLPEKWADVSVSSSVIRNNQNMSHASDTGAPLQTCEAQVNVPPTQEPAPHEPAHSSSTDGGAKPQVHKQYRHLDVAVHDAAALRAVPSHNTVHVKFIPSTMSFADMRKMFFESGEVLKVRVADPDERIAIEKRFCVAFVQYKTAAGAHGCMVLHHKRRVGGFHLCVTYSKAPIAGGLYTDAIDGGRGCTFGLSTQQQHQPGNSSGSARQAPCKSELLKVPETLSCAKPTVANVADAETKAQQQRSRQTATSDALGEYKLTPKFRSTAWTQQQKAHVSTASTPTTPERATTTASKLTTPQTTSKTSVSRTDATLPHDMSDGSGENVKRDTAGCDWIGVAIRALQVRQRSAREDQSTSPLSKKPQSLVSVPSAALLAQVPQLASTHAAVLEYLSTSIEAAYYTAVRLVEASVTAHFRKASSATSSYAGAVSASTWYAALLVHREGQRSRDDVKRVATDLVTFLSSRIDRSAASCCAAVESVHCLVAMAVLADLLGDTAVVDQLLLQGRKSMTSTQDKWCASCSAFTATIGDVLQTYLRRKLLQCHKSTTPRSSSADAFWLAERFFPTVAQHSLISCEESSGGSASDRLAGNVAVSLLTSACAFDVAPSPCQ